MIGNDYLDTIVQYEAVQPKLGTLNDTKFTAIALHVDITTDQW